MLQCPDCGDVEVVSDTSGSEKCRVCAKCGLVLGSDGNFNHISTDGNTTDEQFDVDSLTKVSMELDSRMRYAQRQNYKSQTIGMPSSTRFAAQKVAKDQRKDQNVKADRHVTGKSTRAHKEIFNASRKWLLGKDITGMTIELFDKLIASKKAGSITYDKLAIACLYSVSKSAAVAPPLAEAASLAGVDLHRFGAYLKKVKVFQLKSNELTNESTSKESIKELLGLNGLKGTKQLLMKYSRNVAMKTFNPELDVQNDRTSIQSTDCSAFEQQLLQLAKKLEEFGKTRLHMERYGPTTNVVLSVYVFLAYCVLRQKTKLPVTSGTSFKMPTGTCVNSRLLTKFVEYFGLEWHRSAFGKLNELLTALIIHANELSWVHNCDATNILRYVETVLQRYPSLEVEVKPPISKNPAIVELIDPVPFNHDIYTEEIGEEDMSDTELAAYVKTPKEVEMAERFTKSIEAKSSNVS